MTNKPGRLIVFEGPDGVGKTTLSKALAKHIEGPCEYFSFPGSERNTLGQAIYEIHHRLNRINGIEVDATSLQLLHVAAHIDAIETRILPALKKGSMVILDRFWWSTWVYGCIAGANRKSLETVIELEQNHWGSIQPQVVFLVTRSAPIDQNISSNWIAWSKEYALLSQRESQKHPVHLLRNEGSVEDSFQNTIHYLFQGASQ